MYLCSQCILLSCNCLYYCQPQSMNGKDNRSIKARTGRWFNNNTVALNYDNRTTLSRPGELLTTELMCDFINALPIS